MGYHLKFKILDKKYEEWNKTHKNMLKHDATRVIKRDNEGVDTKMIIEWDGGGGGSEGPKTVWYDILTHPKIMLIW